MVTRSSSPFVPEPGASALGAADRDGAARPSSGQASERRHPGGSELFETVYDELRALARSWFRRQPKHHTLQPTALVHEAFLRLADVAPERVKDRTHFLATAASAMRQILVDHSRRRNAQKRGAGRSRIPLDGVALTHGESELDLEVLHQSLEDLERLNPRQSRIVELRFFGGLTVVETAEVLGIGERTVKLDWQFARAWLLSECQRRSQQE
ncbi:MAG: sigma-70 family RNA polymerase sigma factor [Planctomycetota bacterium]